MNGLLAAIEWSFELGLLGLLLTTLIYMRRLDRLLRQMRGDGKTLQSLVQQIGTSITAAIAAADQLKAESKEAVEILEEACATAAVTTRKLDDLIGQATLIAKRPLGFPAVAAAPIEPVREEIELGAPVVMPLVEVTRPVQPPRVAAPRRAGRPQSRVERDLARMLLDAS